MSRLNTSTPYHDGVKLAPRYLPSITASARARFKDNNIVKRNINKQLLCRGNRSQKDNTSRISSGGQHLISNAWLTPSHDNVIKGSSYLQTHATSKTNPSEKDLLQVLQANHGTNMAPQNGLPLYSGKRESGNSSHIPAREGGGSSVSKAVSGYGNSHNGSQQMPTDNLRGGMPPSLRNPTTPTPQFNQALPGTLLRPEDKKSVSSTCSENNNNNNSPNYHATYVGENKNIANKGTSFLNVTSTSLGKDALWSPQSKSPQTRKVVFASGARGTVAAAGAAATAAGGGGGGTRRRSASNNSMCSRCFSVYSSASTNVKNKWTLLLLFHCGLFLVLALYLAVGVMLLLKMDGGVIHAVKGRGEEERVTFLRGTTAEKLLNVSLKAVVERSRDSVLDTIFMSDEMQAALMAFSTSRLSILPSDHKLELLSNDLLTFWRRRLEEILVKYHLITTMESHGHQLTPKEIKEIWDQPLTILNLDTVYSNPNIEVIDWNTWRGTMHAFGLITTMGIEILSPSHEGRAFTVIYTLFGFMLYSYIIVVWSERLFNVLIVISRAKQPSKMRKITSNDEIQVQNWNSLTPLEYKNQQWEGTTLLMLLSLTLSIVYIIGIGPLVCGSPKNSFGERLEASFLSLFLVKPPSPLPQDGEKCCGFIAYVIVGHFSMGATFRSLTKFFGSSPTEETLRRR